MRDIIVIGASAGGIEALKGLVAGLPAALPASLLVVVHVAAQSPGVLPGLLTRAGPLPAVMAAEGMLVEPGHIYVAPPDYHLLVEQGGLRVTRGPKENHFRPAIDPLFRSAAFTYGARVIGIILSGMLDDGTAGLWAVKQRGGLAVVQTPSEALYAAMPQSALTHVAVDYCLPVTELAALLPQLVEEPLASPGEIPMSEALAIETRIALEENPLASGLLQLGQPSLYTCPECHGVLLRMAEPSLVRFRCHTGHAFTLASLLAALNESVEQALWNTVRLLDEQVFLLHLLTQEGQPTVPDELAQAVVAQVEATEAQRQVLRHLVLKHNRPQDAPALPSGPPFANP